MLIETKYLDLNTKKVVSRTLELPLIEEVTSAGIIMYKHPITKYLHRLDGPAVEYANSYKEWCVEGKLHRLDGPAVEYADGEKGWWIEGKLHRLDGPAVEHLNGYKEWWILGTEYPDEDTWRRTCNRLYNLEIF